MPFVSSVRSQYGPQGKKNTRWRAYAFSTHTFTNAGRIGTEGPTLTETRSAYSGTSWANSIYFGNSNGTQRWQVPSAGTYRIQAAGAAGANHSEGGAATPGYGYELKCDVNLTPGTILNIMVGQVGTYINANTSTGAPGGGASTVWIDGQSQPLIVAAGGNGRSWDSHNVRDPDGQSSGTSPYGGPATGRGTRGASWSSNGSAGVDGNDPNGNATALNSGGYGANYSNSATRTSNMTLSTGTGGGGGFGGGGAGMPYEGGGGGGYFGGWTKTTNDYNNRYTNYGAVSYFGSNTSNQVNIGIRQTYAAGYVTITRL